MQTFIRNMIEGLPEEHRPDSFFMMLTMLIMWTSRPTFQQQYPDTHLRYDTFFAASLFFASMPLYLSDPVFGFNQVTHIVNKYERATDRKSVV